MLLVVPTLGRPGPTRHSPVGDFKAFIKVKTKVYETTRLSTFSRVCNDEATKRSSNPNSALTIPLLLLLHAQYMTMRDVLGR